LHARRVPSGDDPEPPPRPARAARHDRPVHHPRPRPGRLSERPRPRDELGEAGRERPDRGGALAPDPRIHARAAGGRAAAAPERRGEHLGACGRLIERPSPVLSAPDGAPLTWLGVNFWSRAGGPRMWSDAFDAQVVREELGVLAAHGLNVTRSFFYLPDFMPTPYAVEEACAERFGRLLDLSAEATLGSIPTFVGGRMSGEKWDVPWRGGRALYADGWMLARQAYFARAMAARFGWHPAVVGWLLSNEMPLYGGRTSAEYGRSWAELLTQ